MILPEHYPIVGEHLLKAIKEFLGDKATKEIIDAWAVAYGIIAQVFIDTEKKLYDELNPDHGFVPFTIVKKEQVANGPIVSLTLARKDGGKVHPFQAGQYITLQIKKDGRNHNRHYSLIEPFNGKTYRIAIKDEIDREPKGIVSNEIIDNYKEGDEILLNFPAGTFGLFKDAKHNLFIAGGIGITPLSAMVQELNQAGKADSITLIHCVLTKEHAAFAQQLKSILSAENQYQILAEGQRLTKDVLQKVLKSDTHVYLCGSVPFMNKVGDLLSECGHPSSQIHIEAFQPSLSIVKGVVDQAKTKSL
jgi:nitric oxide dioxygenase